jgi:hypothetical protein
MTRTAARIDTNMQEIVRDLRACGASVTPTHMVGRGFPDLVVGWRGGTYLLEVKVGNAKLTPAEMRWHRDWRGQVMIVRTSQQAVDLLRYPPKVAA